MLLFCTAYVPKKWHNNFLLIEIVSPTENKKIQVFFEEFIVLFKVDLLFKHFLSAWKKMKEKEIT